ncbi:gp66 [Mycobacterium phage Fruitloop]|uniref:Uncharacterized protein n=1 Tax=Mycobacterium phage Fruitloop TaxID=2914018 RepID=B5U4R5_9CAUD|nr:gp66 [Mycobacterium phage Fruitloop]ACI12379.1 hypothetical protein FRUITLOOP_66 [Mycobacterium phage Fruitloop]
MNATEDGFEPVGENPEVPARYDAGIASALAAIDRGAVLGIIAGADQVLATNCVDGIRKRRTITLIARDTKRRSDRCLGSTWMTRSLTVSR